MRSPAGGRQAQACRSAISTSELLAGYLGFRRGRGRGVSLLTKFIVDLEANKSIAAEMRGSVNDNRILGIRGERRATRRLSWRGEAMLVKTRQRNASRHLLWHRRHQKSSSAYQALGSVGGRSLMIMERRR